MLSDKGIFLLGVGGLIFLGVSFCVGPLLRPHGFRTEWDGEPKATSAALHEKQSGFGEPLTQAEVHDTLKEMFTPKPRTLQNTSEEERMFWKNAYLYALRIPEIQKKYPVVSEDAADVADRALEAYRGRK